VALHHRPEFREGCYVMIMVDAFTKVLELCILPAKDTTTASKAFHGSWICRYGLHETVVSDRGFEFLGEFHAMLDRLGNQHVPTRARNPRANGKAEICVKATKRILYVLVDDVPAASPELLPYGVYSPLAFSDGFNAFPDADRKTVQIIS
jgi:hypothetical protein